MNRCGQGSLTTGTATYRTTITNGGTATNRATGWTVVAIVAVITIFVAVEQPRQDAGISFIGIDGQPGERQQSTQAELQTV